VLDTLVESSIEGTVAGTRRIEPTPFLGQKPFLDRLLGEAA
jgi:hypothetical protein